MSAAGSALGLVEAVADVHWTKPPWPSWLRATGRRLARRAEQNLSGPVSLSQTPSGLCQQSDLVAAATRDLAVKDGTSLASYRRPSKRLKALWRLGSTTGDLKVNRP